MEMQLVDFGDVDFRGVSRGMRAEFDVEPSYGDWVYKVYVVTSGTSSKPKKTRVFVDGEEKVDYSDAVAASEAAGSFSRGVSVDADKMWDAVNREVVRNKRSVVDEFWGVSRMMRQMFSSDTKFSWSRKAGCSCPCSPGFVSDKVAEVGVVYTDWTGSKVFTTVPVEQVSVSRKPRVAVEAVAA